MYYHIAQVKLNNISCMQAMQVNGVIQYLNQKFGQENKLTIITGNKLEYLGISIDYTTKMKKNNFLFITTSKKFLMSCLRLLDIIKIINDQKCLSSTSKTKIKTRENNERNGSYF